MAQVIKQKGEIEKLVSNSWAGIRLGFLLTFFVMLIFFLSLSAPCSAQSSVTFFIPFSAILFALAVGSKKSRKKEKKQLENIATLNPLLGDLPNIEKTKVMHEILRGLKQELRLDSPDSPMILFKKGEYHIPLAIFSKEVGGLEALCKYLKEELGLSYHEIAQILKRDDRTVWTAYNKSLEKSKKPFLFSFCKYYLPLSIFEDGDLTVLESTITYLKEEKDLRFSEIGKLISRDQRNIWTIYSQAKKKISED